jgi:hypothetical protein
MLFSHALNFVSYCEAINLGNAMMNIQKEVRNNGME